MKKYLSILVLGIALFLPLSASAVTKKVEWHCDNKTCVDTSADTCQRTCTLGLSADASLNEFAFNSTLKLSEGAKVVSVTPANSWKVSDEWKNGTNSVALNFTSTPASTGTKIDIATVVVEINKNATCSLTLEANGDNKTVTIEKEDTVNTGATLPMIVIACGALVAGAVYIISKKNTKMYKI